MLLRVFLIAFFVGYTMMSKELKIGCCFTTEDRDEATDFRGNLFGFYMYATYTCQLGLCVSGKTFFFSMYFN